ncbi:hypothetical protein EE612_029116, partial [Oryza sativa]
GLEGEEAIGEVVEHAHVLLHEVADDGRLVRRQRRVPARRAHHRHAPRRRLHPRPVLLRRDHQLPSAADAIVEPEHQRRHRRRGERVPVVARLHAQLQRAAQLRRRRHEAAAAPQLTRQLLRQRAVGGVDEAGERRAGGEVVECAEGAVLGVLGERHGGHRSAAAAAAGAQAGQLAVADEQVAWANGVPEVGCQAVGELGGVELADERERAPAEPDDAGGAVERPRRDPRLADAAEGEGHRRRRRERERVGAQNAERYAGAVGGSDHARVVAAAAAARAPRRLRRDAAQGAVVLREASAGGGGGGGGKAAGGALRPDEVAAGVDDGFRRLRRVADAVAGDVLRLAGPAEGRGHAARRRRRGRVQEAPVVGALGGAAHALLHGAVLVGVDVGELEAEGGAAG